VIEIASDEFYWRAGKELARHCRARGGVGGGGGGAGGGGWGTAKNARFALTEHRSRHCGGRQCGRRTCGSVAEVPAPPKKNEHCNVTFFGGRSDEVQRPAIGADRGGGCVNEP